MTLTINTIGNDWYQCSKCKNSYFVSCDDPQKHLLKSSMRCPNNLECGGNIKKKKWPESGIIKGNCRQVTALVLFQASAGIGLPEERKCSPTDIRKLLLGSRISALHVENAPDPKRTILMSLTLENGKVVHLTSSTKGALVYKVTEVGNGG